MTDKTDRLLERIQSEFDVEDLDSDTIYDWLTDGRVGGHKIKNGLDKSGEQRYTESEGISSTGLSKIRNLAETIAEIKRIHTQAKSVDNATELEGLRKELNSYPNNYPHKREVQTLIDDKIRQANIRIIEQQRTAEREIEKEERRIEQEADRTERKIEISKLSTEEKRGLLAGNEDERRSAIRALRQISPQSLGGFRRAEIKRGISALADFDKVF